MLVDSHEIVGTVSRVGNETEKRSLSEDDVNGICGTYPASQPQAACFQRLDGGYGCQGVPGETTAPALGAIALLLVGILLRRAR